MNSRIRTAAIIAALSAASIALAACGNGTDTDTQDSAGGNGTIELTGTLISQIIREERGGLAEGQCQNAGDVGSGVLTQEQAAMRVAEAMVAAEDADIAIFNLGGFQTNDRDPGNTWAGVGITDSNLPCQVYPNRAAVFQMPGRAVAGFLAYYDQTHDRLIEALEWGQHSEGVDAQLVQEAEPVAAYADGISGGNLGQGLDADRMYKVVLSDYTIGRLTRGGFITNQTHIDQYLIYEYVGWFIPAAYDPAQR